MADLPARRDLFARASQALADSDDREFATAIGDPPPDARRGWGDSYRAEVGGFQVFVKRLPPADLEYERPGDTSNVFGLPDFYHYGVGSAGHGAFRELAGHRKTTAWVLDGAIESFPLLYHHRVLPRPRPSPDPRFRLEDYVRRWNGSEAVGAMMAAKAEARYELCLAIEPFAHTLGAWLPANQGAAGAALDGLCRTLEHLRSAGVVHFDAHAWNVVGDGGGWYLADFGLVLDDEFDLDDGERAFLRRHRHYDAGATVASLGSVLLAMLDALEAPARQRVERRYGIAPPIAPDRALEALLGRMGDLASDGDLAVDPRMAGALARHREVILYMAGFLSRLRRDPRRTPTTTTPCSGRCSRRPEARAAPRHDATPPRRPPSARQPIRESLAPGDSGHSGESSGPPPVRGVSPCPRGRAGSARGRRASRRSWLRPGGARRVP